MIYLSLGGNLGNTAENFKTAIEKLKAASCKIRRVSPIYQTEPLGYSEQPDFLNLVLAMECVHEPLELLKIMQQIELDLGRVREIANGPRTIDIDLIAFNDLVIDSEELQIPHPRYQDRQFVLVPLAIIDMDFRCPATKKSIEKMLDDCTDQSNIKIAGYL